MKATAGAGVPGARRLAAAWALLLVGLHCLALARPAGAFRTFWDVLPSEADGWSGGAHCDLEANPLAECGRRRANDAARSSGSPLWDQPAEVRTGASEEGGRMVRPAVKSAVRTVLPEASVPSWPQGA